MSNTSNKTGDRAFGSDAANATYQSLSDNPTSSQSHSYAKDFYKTLTVSSVIVDLIFVVFMFNAVREAVTRGLDEAGIENELLENLLMIAGYFFSGMNTIGDTLAVNPVEDAEDISTLSSKTLKKELEDAGKCESIATRSLTLINQSLAQASYMVGASGDAVAFAYLASNTIYRWGTGIPVTLLGIIYYNMLTRVAINEHAHEFVHRLTAKESTLIKAIKSPAKTLEVIIQSLSNGIYRGVGFGYIMEQLLTTLFEKKEGDPSNVYFISAAALATLYVTLFSRTLNVHKKVFSTIDRTKVSKDILSRSEVSKFNLADIMLTTLRAIPASILLHKYSGISNPIIDYASSSALGLLLMAHGLYVRYGMRLDQAVAQELKKEQLLGDISPTLEPKSSAELFDAIQETLKTDKLRNIVTILNVCGRAARSIVLFGFITVLNDSLKQRGIDLKLDFLSLACLHQLWGNTTLENEASFFQRFLVENTSYNGAKFHIQKYNPGFGLIKSMLWKAKKDFPVDCLQRALQEITSKDALGITIEDDEEKHEGATARQSLLPRNAN